MEELRKAQFELAQKRQHASNIQGHINELEPGGRSDPVIAGQIAELRPQLENALQAVTDAEAEVARLTELGVASEPRASYGALHPPGAHHPPGSTVPPGPAPAHVKPEPHTPRPKSDPRKKHGH